MDDLVLKRGDRERALAAIRFRNIPPPRWLRPVCSSMYPLVQILDPAIKIGLVGLPRQPIDARGGIALEREKRRSEHRCADVVEERGEPLLLVSPCDLWYALQRLGHVFPVLRPARALLARVPLGPGPSLHRLRRRSLGDVRRLHRYYARV